jgi:hypothetical protein
MTDNRKSVFLFDKPTDKTYDLLNQMSESLSAIAEAILTGPPQDTVLTDTLEALRTLTAMLERLAEERGQPPQVTVKAPKIPISVTVPEQPAWKRIYGNVTSRDYKGDIESFELVRIE